MSKAEREYQYYELCAAANAMHAAFFRIEAMADAICPYNDDEGRAYNEAFHLNLAFDYDRVAAEMRAENAAFLLERAA